MLDPNLQLGLDVVGSDRAGNQSCFHHASTRATGDFHVHPVHDLSQDLLGIEEFVSDFTRRRGVPGIVGLDRVQSGKDVVHRLEGEQASAGRQRTAEGRVLGNHRASSGEVTCAAIAEPTGLQERTYWSLAMVNSPAEAAI